MARRSPLNPRYQKNTGPAGKTRRSASSAKPKREAGGHAPAPKKAKPTLREALRGGPSTPEMKRWRQIWWGAIGAAFVVALLAAFVPAVKNNRVLLLAATVAYLVFLGGAVYIDLGIIRKLRREAMEAARRGKQK